MFDLFRSRDKMVKILLGVLLGVVALSMVTYLVPNTYDDPLYSSGDPVLAEIGGEKIYASQALQAFQANYTQGDIPPELMQVYFPQFLENMISQRAAVYQAQQMGLKVTDEEVLVGMESQFPEYFKNGKVLSMDNFTAALAQIGATPQLAMDSIRSQLFLVKVQDVVMESAVVTPQEVERTFRQKYERAALQYVAFNADSLRSQVTITDQEARDRFERDKALYNEPAKYSFRVAVLDQFNVESRIQVTEQDLRNTYNSVLDNFRLPEQVHARHILVAEESKARDLKKQLDGGADFAKLAMDNSEDGGTASTGGDLGMMTRGTTIDPAFEEAAFALKAGQISGVIKTDFGYHVIQVVEREPSRVQSFDEVRSLLEGETRASLINQRMQSAAERIRQAFSQTPATAGQVVAEVGGELVQVTEAPLGDPIPTLGVSPEIDSALGGLQPGGVTGVLQLPAERQVVAVLDKVTPSRPSTFQEVEAQIRDKVFLERSTQLAEQLAQQVADRVRAGEPIADVARALNAAVVTSNSFSRNDNIDGLGPAAYMEEAFSAKIGDVLGPTSVQNQNVVAVVTGKTEADMTTLDFERDELVLALKRDKATKINELWQDSIVSKLTEDGVVIRHDDQIKLILSQMR